MENFNALQLEYNTIRDNLTISEHGRHVQKLINYAKNIQDDEYRQTFVEAIINLMEQMNPQNKKVTEYRLRLWKHLLRIANYDIKVTVPEGIETTPPKATVLTDKPSYPQSDFRFRHYGHFVQNMIKKAIDMEDGEIKAEFINVIGFYMKLAYHTWNHNLFVNDETIKSDLKMMSKGQLVMDDDHIINIKSSVAAIKKDESNNKNKSRGKNNNNRGRNNNTSRKRSSNNKNYRRK